MDMTSALNAFKKLIESDPNMKLLLDTISRAGNYAYDLLREPIISEVHPRVNSFTKRVGLGTF